MMRIWIVLLLATVLVSSGCTHSAPVAAGAPDSAEQSASEQSTTAAPSADDREKLQGTWKMDRATFNGQPLMNDVRWIIDSEHLTIVLQGNYEGGVKAQYELGVGDAPNTIKIKMFDNPLADKGYYGGSYTGLYKLSGDKLRICYDLTGRQYPKSFDAGKGSRRMYYEFTRDKTEQHAGE